MTVNHPCLVRVVHNLYDTLEDLFALYASNQDVINLERIESRVHNAVWREPMVRRVLMFRFDPFELVVEFADFDVFLFTIPTNKGITIERLNHLCKAYK